MAVLPTPRIPHQQRVVLAASAQHLDAAFHLIRASDQRIDIASSSLGVQIHAVFSQRAFFLFGFAGCGLGVFFHLIRTGYRPAFAISRILGDAMRDEIDRVVTGHVLLLQEIGGIAFAFGEYGDQNVGAGHFGPARALNVDRRALYDALERCSGYGFGSVDIRDQIRKVLVYEFHQSAAQLVQIDTARFHDAHGIGFFQKRQQQMLQRCEFMAPFIRSRQGRVDGLFQCARE